MKCQQKLFPFKLVCRGPPTSSFWSQLRSTCIHQYTQEPCIRKNCGLLCIDNDYQCIKLILQGMCVTAWRFICDCRKLLKHFVLEMCHYLQPELVLLWKTLCSMLKGANLDMKKVGFTVACWLSAVGEGVLCVCPRVHSPLWRSS